MTEEEHLLHIDELTKLEGIDPTVDFMQETMDSFMATARVEAVYGAPVEHGDTLILPAAEVVSVLGFGVGSGSGGSGDEGSGQGIGGGGGGRTFSRPVAVVIATPDYVHVQPIFDITKIALAGFTAGAFMFGMALRMLNPRQSLEDLQKGKWG